MRHRDGGGDLDRVRYLDCPAATRSGGRAGHTGLDHLYGDTRGVRAARAEGNAGSDHPRPVTTVARKWNTF